MLLAEAVRQARSAGLRVLQVTGRESEQDLAFAGLHQLLRPVLDRVADLPGRQAEALLGAFGLSAEPPPAGALLTGLAVLTLLSRLSENRPLLVVADDAQWLDRGSLDTLGFAARRLESEPLVLLLGARGNLPPAGFERDFPDLLLKPLSTQDAGRLLDAQPHPPRGRQPDGADRAVPDDRGRPGRRAALGRRTPAAHRPARRHYRRPLRCPLRAGPGGAAAGRRRRQPGHDGGGRVRADRRRGRPGRDRGPDQGGQIRAAIHPPPRPRRGLPRRPVRRARRGPPEDRGLAPRAARPLR